MAESYGLDLELAQDLKSEMLNQSRPSHEA